MHTPSNHLLGPFTFLVLLVSMNLPMVASATGPCGDDSRPFMGTGVEGRTQVKNRTASTSFTVFFTRDDEQVARKVVEPGEDVHVLLRSETGTTRVGAVIYSVEETLETLSGGAKCDWSFRVRDNKSLTGGTTDWAAGSIDGYCTPHRDIHLYQAKCERSYNGEKSRWLTYFTIED